VVFLGRWISDKLFMDQLDSKDKLRFSGSSGAGFFKDALWIGLGFSGSWINWFFSIWIDWFFWILERLVFQDLVFWLLVFLDSWIRALTLCSNVFRRIKVEVD